jgi:hypothetical protein
VEHVKTPHLRTVAGLLLVFLVSFSALYAQEATPEPEIESLPEGVERIDASIPLLGPFEHTIELKAGDVLTVIARDPLEAVDVILTLLDPSGEMIAENDNHELALIALGPDDAVLDHVTIEADGEYRVQVDNRFYESGEVELYLITAVDLDLELLFSGDPDATPEPEIRLEERPQLRTTGPCTASVDFIAARLREVPTANAPQVASLLPGTSFLITGKVRGADNLTWYRLENYLWVRADAVIAAGNCSAVPAF